MLSFIIRPILSNRLRKESNKLKAEYDNLKDELYHYGESIAHEKAREVNTLIESLSSRLENEQEFLNGISQPFKEYIRLSFDVNLFYTQRKLAYTKRNEILGRKQFLISDIEQTKLEIEELKNSKTKLLSSGNMKFYMELLKFNNICVDTEKSFIINVRELIKNKDISPEEKKALSRLESLIMEQLYLKEEIKKLDWAIAQKYNKIEINKIEKMNCFEVIDIIYEIIDKLNKKINDIENNRFEIAASINQRIHAKPSDLIYALEELNKTKSELNRIYEIHDDDKADDDRDMIRTLMNKKKCLINTINILYQEHREQVQYRWHIICEVLNLYNLKFIVKRKELNNKQGVTNEDKIGFCA